MKRLFVIFCAIIICSASASASGNYYSYTYQYNSDGSVTDVLSPLPYLPQKVFDSANLPVALQSPEDIVIDNQNNFYIADSSANAVYCFDADFALKRTITQYTIEGKTYQLNAPNGLFVDEEGTVFVADTGNGRVAAIDRDNKCIGKIEKPKTELIAENFNFYPMKVAVDEAGRVFVLVKDVFEGLMQFTSEGEFVGFVGSNRVKFTISEMLWKMVMTPEQRAKLLSFVPVEYTNISLDEIGFIYAVTSVRNIDTPIRRLNPSGDDILIREPLDGSQKVVGDVIYPQSITGDDIGPSSFVDITQDHRGNYYALDGKRGRIFAYDEQGNLLFVFGGIGSKQKGNFLNPVALVHVDEKIYVLDNSLRSVTVFTPTEYTSKIHEATNEYISQNYKKSIQLWNQVIKMNANFNLAYMKSGYAYYRMGDYDNAMKNFKVANAKEAYSKAYVKAVKYKMNSTLGWQLPLWIGIALILILFFILIKKRIIRKKLTKGANVQ